MPRYLLNVSYTQEGLRGLLKEGGTSRRDTVADLVKEQGGTLETMYFAFGSDDVIVIAEMPDAASAAAVALTVSASGAAHVSTTALLTPAEIDQASKKTVTYRRPGEEIRRAA
jgi:uncharacterized protein with GYD domain